MYSISRGKGGGHISGIKVVLIKQVKANIPVCV